MACTKGNSLTQLERSKSCSLRMADRYSYSFTRRAGLLRSLQHQINESSVCTARADAPLMINLRDDFDFNPPTAKNVSPWRSFYFFYSGRLSFSISHTLLYSVQPAQTPCRAPFLQNVAGNALSSTSRSLRRQSFLKTICAWASVSSIPSFIVQSFVIHSFKLSTIPPSIHSFIHSFIHFFFLPAFLSLGLCFPFSLAFSDFIH